MFHTATVLEGPMPLPAKRIKALIAVFLVLVCGSAWAQDSPHIGLKIRTLTAELRKQRNLAGDVKGALVTAVNPGSAAHEKGIVVGDIIVEAGGKPIASVKEVASQIAAAVGSHADTILLRVMDGKGDRRNVTVAIPKRPTEGSPLILPGPK
jgi:S1-C subfamily serine protease